MSPSRHRNTRVWSVALVCVAALLLGACHGSGSKGSTTSGSGGPSTDAKGKPRVSLALHLGKLSVQAVTPAHKFNPITAAAILKLMNGYVSTAITTPLFTGRESLNLARFFEPTLVSRVGLKGHDRPALTDEHAPVITNVTSATKQPLNLVGLQNNGQLLMIGARFGLTVTGTTAQGPLTVSRIGNFVFEPNAAHQWVISGYDIIVRRDNSGTLTTQKATTTTAAK